MPLEESEWPPATSAVRVRLYLAGELQPDTLDMQDMLAMDFAACITRSEAERQIWLDIEHPDLGNRTPRHCIQFAQSGAVITILANALREIPS